MLFFVWHVKGIPRGVSACRTPLGFFAQREELRRREDNNVFTLREEGERTAGLSVAIELCCQNVQVGILNTKAASGNSTCITGSRCVAFIIFHKCAVAFVHSFCVTEHIKAFDVTSLINALRKEWELQ